MLVALALFCYNSYAQTLNYNFDFEDWYVDTLGEERLRIWQNLLRHDSPNPNTSSHGTDKVTDSKTGNFALQLSRWYMHAFDIAAQKSAVSSQHNFLNGYYKYNDVELIFGPSVEDTALITIYFTKWNINANKADTVGFGAKELQKSPNYSSFSNRSLTPIMMFLIVSYCIYSLPNAILIVVHARIVQSVPF